MNPKHCNQAAFKFHEKTKHFFEKTHANKGVNKSDSLKCVSNQQQKFLTAC